MRILAIAMIAAVATTAAAAEAPSVVSPVISGKVQLDVTETAGNNYGSSMKLDFDVDAGDVATVDLDFSAKDGNALTLDTWTVGTKITGLGVAFGDNNDLMPETTADAAANGTLANPAMTESLMVTNNNVSVAIGLAAYTTDLADVSNLQGAYAVDTDAFGLAVSVDYNRTSENYVWGSAISGLAVGAVTAGSMLTYDNDADHFAYEGTVETGAFTAYINGDQDDATQNVGGEYTTALGGSAFTAGANYDLDKEDLTPKLGLSFNF